MAIPAGPRLGEEATVEEPGVGLVEIGSVWNGHGKALLRRRHLTSFIGISEP